MSSHTLRWTRRAVRRLDQIGSYIGQDDPEAVARIVATVDNISRHPAMGRVGRIKRTREFAFADIPYIVAYRVTPEVVEVLTVIHGSQHWPLEFD